MNSTKRSLRQIRPGKIMMIVLLVIGSILVIAPFLWIFSSSLRPFTEANSLPPKWLPPPIGKWNWSNYVKLFQLHVPFNIFFKNSFIMSSIITAGMVFHGTLAGYAYARLPFKGKKIMFSLFLVTMMIPIQVTIIPLFKIMSTLKLVNTMWAVVLPSLFGAMAPGTAGGFGIFLMRQFFLGIPKELEDAASIDGAGPMRTFFLIMLPQAKAVIASLAIIVFAFSWNDYFISLTMINNTEKMPVTVGILATRPPFNVADNYMLAAVALSILPVFIVFLIGQKWIIKSMVQSGIKG